MAVMQPYYYMVYAIRRMLGSEGDAWDFGHIGPLLLHVDPGPVAGGAAFRPAPDSFRHGTASLGGVGVGIPVVIASWWTGGGRNAYARYAARFMRGHAQACDGGCGCAGVWRVALAAPFVAKSLAG
jgi:hypothetical protein